MEDFDFLLNSAFLGTGDGLNTQEEGAIAECLQEMLYTEALLPAETESFKRRLPDESQSCPVATPYEDLATDNPTLQAAHSATLYTDTHLQEASHAESAKRRKCNDSTKPSQAYKPSTEEPHSLSFNACDALKALYRPPQRPISVEERCSIHEAPFLGIEERPTDEDSALWSVGYDLLSRPQRLHIYSAREASDLHTFVQRDRSQRNATETLRPMSDLLRRIEEEEMERFQSESVCVESSFPGMNHSVTDTLDKDEAVALPIVENHQLWVDKYRPKYYSELLSDEAIKLEVLMWLKNWDTFVFKRIAKSFVARTEKWMDVRRESVKSEAAIPSQDILKGQPRVLLIGGPPGIGKTTLVQVIARHCGYEILEINASDDRTKDNLIPLVKGVVCTAGVGTQQPSKRQPGHKQLSQGIQNPMPFKTNKTKSIPSKATKWAQRATLCVLDEIDGVVSNKEGKRDEEKGTIAAIVNLIDAKDTKGKPIIKRPIICICNDLWGKNLKPLREKARVVFIPSPSESLLQQRIDHILQRENLESEPNFSTRLIRLHSSDIRACINTLGFIAREKINQKNRRLTSLDLEAYSFVKDKDQDKLELLNLTFCSHSFNSTRTERSERFNKLMEYILSNASLGANYRFASAFEENYSLASYTDTRLERTAYLLDLLAQGDCLTSAAMTFANEALYVYGALTPFLFAATNCSTTYSQKWKLGGLSKDWLATREMKAKRTMLVLMAAQTAPQLTSQLLGKYFASEIVGFLLKLVLPPKQLHQKIWYKYKHYLEAFKANNCAHVLGLHNKDYSALCKDQKEFHAISNFFKIIALMSTYGLNLHRVSDGNRQSQAASTKLNQQISYELEPSLHTMCVFKCEDTANTSVSNTLSTSFQKTYVEFPPPALCYHINEAKNYFNRTCDSSASLTVRIKELLQFGLPYALTELMQPSKTNSVKQTQQGCSTLDPSYQLQSADRFYPNFWEFLQRERLFANAIVSSAGIKTIANPTLSVSNVENGAVSKPVHRITVSPILGLPTNGYFRYEMGRCNAVSLPLTMQF